MNNSGQNKSQDNTIKGFGWDEKYLSQIPALQLLVNLGYTYLSPGRVMKERGNKVSNILLDTILAARLKKINRIYHKGREYLFSEENIQSAIQKLKNVHYNGLLRTNESIYDLLTLGTTQEQTIEGSVKSFNFYYIDWLRPERNVFHVTPEFSVERFRSSETARPDIVLFVNGIPLCVIECKSPGIDISQAISQMIRNQQNDYIPGLFIYTQLVAVVNKNSAHYATVGSSAKFWFIWKELSDQEQTLASIINRPLHDADKDRLFNGEFSPARDFFNTLETKEPRQITEQDKTLYSLCRPDAPDVSQCLLHRLYRHTPGKKGKK